MAIDGPWPVTDMINFDATGTIMTFGADHDPVTVPSVPNGSRIM
jgi:hypothetical protein